MEILMQTQVQFDYKVTGFTIYNLSESETMSTQKSRVVVHSKLTAVSSRPVNPGMTHPFTALDHAMALHSLHLIFYYKERFFRNFDLDPLRVSLSEVLSLYPPVTGRIARTQEGNWEVKCNDAGVRVLLARVGTTLDEWLRSADGTEERLLTNWDDMPHDPTTLSPYRIQINEFEGGGVAIGLSCSHMHADPTCATLLLKSWAETVRGEPITHPPLFNGWPAVPGRPNVQNKINTKSVASYYAAKSMAQSTTPSKKMGTATFKFSDAMIKQRLLQVHETCPDATPFDLLAALFWTHIARLKPPKCDTKHSLSICIDFRKKLVQLQAPELSYGYYGNALHFSMLYVLDVEEKEDLNGLGSVAGLVHRHVSNQEVEFWSGIDWFESQKGDLGDKFGAPFRMYGPELTCVSMEHMIGVPGSSGVNEDALMYAACRFEKEKKPVHVSYHVGNVEGEGLIMVMPSPEGGLARMVMVTLPEEELAQLCEARAILSLNPTMLLCGRQTY